ncbi:hydantoinase/oxoprolinase family protein [Streptomyces mayteni]
MIRIGVDVGGTFTDVTALDTTTGRFHILKIPTTVQDQSLAVAEGVAEALGLAGASPADVGYLGHGTTIATNALLELKGARTATLVTRGVRDVLEIARQRRPHLYDLFADKPPTLVPRSRTHEITERVDATGRVLVPFDPADVAAAVARMRADGVTAVAVCFLHSYRNPEHERAAEAELRRLAPDLHISRSSAVAPEFREYERFSTAVINSFVGPTMSRYISALAERVERAGVPAGVQVIQSNGGLASPATVSRRPVTTLMSGPSAGVIGAIHVAGLAGVTDLITFDMGGTSTDVCLIRDGAATAAGERGIGGYPVRVPSVDVHTVGAGGGSIAAADGAGPLRVGPESAGAQPGPAAYGRGGTRPTTTDANVVRGRQNPAAALGGKLTMDGQAAGAALTGLAAELGGDALTAARGVTRLANSHMARAVRKVSVDNGEDPREFTLMAYGGAGPLHAVEVAAEVGMRRVLVPAHPGTLCALGLLVSDIRTEFTRSFLRPAEPDALDDVNAALRDLGREATDWLAGEAADAARRSVLVAADARYPRQNFELRLALPAIELDAAALAELVADFHRQHEKSYGFAHPGSPVQLVNLRVTALGEVPRPALPRLQDGAAEPPAEAVTGHRQVDFGAADGPVPTTVYDRARLLAGNRLAGPAVIEQLDATTVLPPGSTAEVDPFGNLLIDLSQLTEVGHHA